MSEAVLQGENTSAAEATTTPGSQAGEAAGENAAKEEARAGYKLRQTERQVAALQAQNSSTQSELQQWQSWWQQEGQNLHQQAQQQSASGENGAAADPNEELIRRELGQNGTRDEAGDEAYSTLEKHFEHKMQKKGLVDANSVQRMIDDRLGGFTNQLKSGYTNANKVQAWVDTSMMTPEHAATLQQRANAVVEANPRLRDEPTNMSFLLDHILADSVSKKEFMPYRVPRQESTNPLVAGGGSSMGEVREADWKPENTRFQRLRSLKLEDVKRIDADSVRRHNQGAPA